MSEDLPSIHHHVQSIQNWLQREDEELLYTPDPQDTIIISDDIPDWINSSYTFVGNGSSQSYRTPLPKKSFLAKLRSPYSFTGFIAIVICDIIATCIAIFLILAN